MEETSDLGASMQFGARHRHPHMQKRLKAVMPFWQKLRQLRCSGWHKQWAVKSALLPRALHNSSHVVLGDHWFSKLRAGIMRGLKCNRAGANAMIRLSWLCSIEVDPGYYDWWHSLRDFYVFVRGNQQIGGLWSAYCTADGRRTYGPFAKLVSLLHTVGWRIDSELCLRILGKSTVDLRVLSLESLKFFAQYFWRQHVHRRDMADLCGVDFYATCCAFTPTDRAELELLHCIRDGTFHLNEIKCKFDPEFSGLCLHCGAWDSLEHRALTCEFYSEVRSRFDDCVCAWHSVPRACSHHGLISENPWQLEYWACLADGGIQMLFTDGACADPTVKEVSLAAWSVVCASSGLPLGSGILPSVCQTINRAELWAVYVALRWALDFHVVPWIYSDSQYVVNGVEFLLRGGDPPSDWENLDLWRRIHATIVAFGSCPQIFKTKAHRSLHDAETEQDAWEIHWNAEADVNAKAALLTAGTPKLRHIYDQLKLVHARHVAYAKRFQSFLLALAIRSREDLARAKETEEMDIFVPEHADAFTSNMGGLADAFPLLWQRALSKSAVLCRMGLPLVESFVAWLLDLDSRADFCAHVTMLEVLFAFRLETKKYMPIQVAVGSRSEWQDPAALRVGELSLGTVASQLRTLQTLLEGVFHAMDYDAEWCELDKPHLGICKQLPAVLLPWPGETSGRVHFELQSFTARRPVRKACDLSRPWR